ncbi:hypothetical protein [Streptomyces melanogenes]|uniref:hypothetical protein n=1 Tax=Streptomyces melanogenes TaxID=67326 RepID=UPI00167CC824|nr:hypothetical protein [Streptomyces melanogenes]GGP86523.1 hypothetical protein GCM10010278_76290 [Streptomyces melanogenes]
MAQARSPEPGADTPVATVYATRAWYTAMLNQTMQVKTDLGGRVERLEAELDSAQAQLKHTDNSIEALQRVLDTVDDWIRKLTVGEEKRKPEGKGAAAKRKTPARTQSATRPRARVRNEEAGDG